MIKEPIIILQKDAQKFKLSDRNLSCRYIATETLILGWKFLIILFVLGHIWTGLRLCFMLGPKRFFTIGWSWFDFAMALCFLFTFMFWLAAWADVAANQDEELPRRYWDGFDPSLISEGLLVLATILAFLRLYLPMSLNYYLGPLQVCLLDCRPDARSQ